MRKQAIIFDVDGTLVDTNAAHVEAWERAFSAKGYRVARERIRPEVGKGGDKLVPSILGDAEDERAGEALRGLHGEYFLELARTRHFSVFPGVKALLRDLRLRGVRIAAATSSNQDHFEATMKSSGLLIEELVDEVVTKSEAGESKPAPDLVEAAVAKLSLPAESCVMVGDTPYDAEASRKAHVPCVGLVCGGMFDGRELMRAGASQVYQDPEDLRQHLDHVIH